MPRRVGWEGPTPGRCLPGARRCTAASKNQLGGQCRRPASRMSKAALCVMHGGTKKTRLIIRDNRKPLPRGLYAVRAEGALRELLEQFEKAPDERMQLGDEVDAARAMAATAWDLYNKVCKRHEEDPDKWPFSAVNAARLAAVEAHEHVAAMVTSFAKVSLVAPSVLDAQTLGLFLRGLSERLGGALSQWPEAQEAALKALRDARLPGRAAPSVTVQIE